MDTPAAPTIPQAVIPAGFWRRWSARFIDQFVLVVLCMVTLAVAASVDADAYPHTSTLELAKRVAIALYFLLAGSYFVGMESSRLQATIGKRLLGIKAVDPSGHRLSVRRALDRWVAAAFSWLSLGFGFAMAGFGKKLAMHDYISRTLVVDRWAYTGFPERQRRTNLGDRAFGVMALFVALAVPVVAAQYSDYVIRSQISEGISLADGVKTAMVEFHQSHGRWPASNAEAGLNATISGSYVRQIEVGTSPGRIAIEYSSVAPQSAHRKINGRHLYLDASVAGIEFDWTCHSEDLRQADCPSRCRCTW